MELINYQGSKQLLVDYIYKEAKPFLDDQKVFCDIFSGSGAVTKYFLDKTAVYANDCEN